MWAARLLGDPRNVRCTIERLDDGTGVPVDTQAFNFGELGLAQMDVVYGVEDRPRAGEPSEVVRLAADLRRRRRLAERGCPHESAHASTRSSQGSASSA